MALLAAVVDAKRGVAERATSGNGGVAATGKSGSPASGSGADAVQSRLWRIACPRAGPR
ncbi:hypothetical protein D3C75_1169620 [compost metagenome]